MKFVSMRDFRNQTTAIREALRSEHEIVVTSNGRPFAILAEVDEETFETKLKALRRARAHALLDRVHRKAKERGVDKMTMDEIDAEIAAARRERQNDR